MTEIAPQSEAPKGEAFYAGALARITRLIPILAAVALPLPAWRSGWRGMAGWLLGSCVSYVNFRSLVGAVDALGERIVVGGKSEKGRKIVAKFLLRYALFGFAAYAIVKYSAGSLYWALAGLFLPVAAAMCEAVYELSVALRRPNLGSE
jgi:hypothetical protein